MYSFSAKFTHGLVLFSLRRAMSYETPQMTLARLQTIPKKKELIKYDAQTGEVFLHHAARGEISLAEAEEIIANLGEKDAAALSKIKNNHGTLPLLSALRYPQTEDQKIIKSRLERLTTIHYQKPLFEPVDQNEVMSRYHGLALSPKKKEELEIGCKVVNQIRGLKLASTTHTSVNEVSAEEFVSTGLKMLKIREISSAGALRISQYYPRDDFKKMQVALITEEIKPALEYRVGNCHEYAMIALFLMVEEFNKDCAEFVKISNDNHVFAMLGRENGAEGVVVDAHQGDVYLERDIPKYLMDSENVKMDLRNAVGPMWRIMTSYNERINSIETTFSMTYNNFHFRKASGPKKR